MSTAKETPPGSGIYGRFTLDDHHHHLARHPQGGKWVTFCGEIVPDGHHCPSRKEINDKCWEYTTCWPCDLAYRKEHGMEILPDHPAQ